MERRVSVALGSHVVVPAYETGQRLNVFDVPRLGRFGNRHVDDPGLREYLDRVLPSISESVWRKFYRCDIQQKHSVLAVMRGYENWLANVSMEQRSVHGDASRQPRPAVPTSVDFHFRCHASSSARQGAPVRGGVARELHGPQRAAVFDRGHQGHCTEYHDEVRGLGSMGPGPARRAGAGLPNAS